MFFRAIIAAGLLCLSLPQLANAEDILYGSYVGPNHGHNVYGLKRFFDDATKQDPDLKFKLVPGGALVGAKTTLAGVRDGVVDGGLIVSLYHTNDLPYNAVIADMAAWTGRAAVNAGAVNETTLLDCPGCMKEWEKWNIKHLGAYASTPYAVICRVPVKSLADLKGKKIRGAGALGRWITALGGVPVNATISEVYEGLQRGQLDCTVGSPGMMKSFSFWDVAKYILDVPSGGYLGGSMINMNLDRWKGLSDAAKKAYIHAAAAGVRGSTIDGYRGDDLRAEAQFKERGITMTEPTADVVAMLDKHRKAEIAVVIATAKKRGVENPEAIVNAYLKNIAKWNKIVDKIGPDDGDAFEAALRTEIYDKVKF